MTRSFGVNLMWRRINSIIPLLVYLGAGCFTLYWGFRATSIVGLTFGTVLVYMMSIPWFIIAWFQFRGMDWQHAISIPYSIFLVWFSLPALMEEIFIRAPIKGSVAVDLVLYLILLSLACLLGYIHGRKYPLRVKLATKISASCSFTAFGIYTLLVFLDLITIGASITMAAYWLLLGILLLAMGISELISLYLMHSRKQ